MGRMVQTELNEAEYQLLRQVSERKRKPLRALLKEAVIRYLEEEAPLTPDDPLFGPPSSKTGAPDGSVAHDKYLYGGGE